jgi:hypothetical protein
MGIKGVPGTKVVQVVQVALMVQAVLAVQEALEAQAEKAALEEVLFTQGHTPTWLLQSRDRSLLYLAL